jgi:hypothetical protein
VSGLFRQCQVLSGVCDEAQSFDCHSQMPRQILDEAAWYAAGSGSIDMLRVLLHKGIPVFEHHTLEIAERHGHLLVCKQLYLEQYPETEQLWAGGRARLRSPAAVFMIYRVAQQHSSFNRILQRFEKMRNNSSDNNWYV